MTNASTCKIPTATTHNSKPTASLQLRERWIGSVRTLNLELLADGTHTSCHRQPHPRREQAAGGEQDKHETGDDVPIISTDTVSEAFSESRTGRLTFRLVDGTQG